MFFSLRKVLLFSALAIAICSCNEDKDGDGVPNNKDKCPTVAAKNADGCPVEQKIKDIRFFIDRSGSMNGYYKGATEFVDNNVDLLAKVESIAPVKEVWLVGEGSEKYNGDARSFRNQMPRTQPKGEKSSLMDKIFETIAAKTSKDDISVFVSDGILSYSDKDIRSNPRINKEKASALGTDIYTTFHTLVKNKGFGASIYAFKSAFNGTYYNYQNGKIKLTGDKRPYYVWVIGRKELLHKFNTQMAGVSTFKPLEQLHFGLDEEPVTNGKYIPSAERKGDWAVNDDATGIKDIGKSPATFCLAVDLSSLPPYAQQVSYLNKHLVLNTQGCEAEITAKDKKAIDRSKLRSNRQKEDFEAATHVFVVTIKRMNTNQGELQINMPIEPDTWYQRWSCDDDLNLEQDCAGKTFSFSYLVEGVMQAYENNNKNYIVIPVALKQ